MLKKYTLNRDTCIIVLTNKTEFVFLHIPKSLPSTTIHANRLFGHTK